MRLCSQSSSKFDVQATWFWGCESGLISFDPHQTVKPSTSLFNMHCSRLPDYVHLHAHVSVSSLSLRHWMQRRLRSVCDPQCGNAIGLPACAEESSCDQFFRICKF